MTILDITRRLIGRRHTISRDEMAAIIIAIGLPPEASTIADIGNDELYVGGQWVRDPAQWPEAVANAWARICAGITCVSVIAGTIRHDEPGSLHPMQVADVTFAPESLRDYAYMRKHSRRLLIVRDVPLTSDLDRESAAAAALAAQGADKWARLRRSLATDGVWVRVLDDGVLEIRDSNDGQDPDPLRKIRYQYRVSEGGMLQHRALPPESIGDVWRDTGSPDWEDREPPRHGPVWDYYEAVAL